jgi:hypothetical protein
VNDVAHGPFARRRAREDTEYTHRTSMVGITSLRRVVVVGSFLATAVSCAQSSGVDASTLGTSGSSAAGSEDAGGSETGAQDCSGPSISDLAVSIVATADGELPTIAGSCTVENISTADVIAVELSCVLDGTEQDVVVGWESGAGAPAPALVQGASVEVVRSRLESLERGRWIAVSDAEGLVLAAGSGSVLDADFRGPPSQGMWSPLEVSAQPSWCESASTMCNTAVQRAGLSFSGLFADPVDVFDHAVVGADGYTIAAGDVLLAVGTGTCDGASGSWFDFAVVRSS